MAVYLRMAGKGGIVEYTYQARLVSALRAMQQVPCRIPATGFVLSWRCLVITTRPLARLLLTIPVTVRLIRHSLVPILSVLTLIIPI